MVSKLAAEHVKVVLSGDGGDEIFAGYERYLVERDERRFDRIPSPLRRVAGAVGDSMREGATGRRFLQHLALTGPRRYLDAATFFRGDDLQALLTPEAFEQVRRHDPLADAMGMIGAGTGARPYDGIGARRGDGVGATPRGCPSSGSDWLGDIQRFDLHRYLPLDILTKVDRMTMAHSIEARPPLLDHKLVEFAATVPAKLRMRGGTTKHLFKKAMRDVLPDNIIDRPKHGFAVPLAHWFRGELAPFAHDVLLSGTCRQRGIFQPAQVEQLLRMNTQGRDCDLQLWTLLSFELWCRRFIDAHVNVGLRQGEARLAPAASA
jgi:asparagine synthase (glutamine-hydrolysing)